MNNLSEKLSYIHGMMDGLKLDRDDDIVKLLGMITDVLDDAAAAITQLENDQQELNDYVESIDDDLTDLEEQHRDDNMDDDGYDIMTDEVPAQRGRGKLSLLHNADEDDEDDEEEDDEDYDDLAETEFYVGCVCPECGKFFSVKNPDDYDDDQKFECPHCLKHIVIAPMDLESIPTARPVEN